MSPVRLIILLVAAAAAIGAVFIVRSVGSPAPATAASVPMPVAVAEKPREAPARQVLVASHAIPAGRYVSADDLKWQEWPANAPASSFVDKKTDPEALEKMVGAVARYPLVEGEPVTNGKLQQPGTAGFMAVMLTPGMRAASIRIDPEAAAGGFIQPNDRVDVILTRSRDNNGGEGQGSGGGKGVSSDLILANVRVLAIDAEYSPPRSQDGGGPRGGQGIALIGSRATLELSEADATLLNAARKAGDLSLTLRSIADQNSPEGATPVGRAYRNGGGQGAEGIRVYRYGAESISPGPSH